MSTASFRIQKRNKKSENKRRKERKETNKLMANKPKGKETHTRLNGEFYGQANDDDDDDKHIFVYTCFILIQRRQISTCTDV